MVPSLPVTGGGWRSRLQWAECLHDGLHEAGTAVVHIDRVGVPANGTEIDQTKDVFTTMCVYLKNLCRAVEAKGTINTKPYIIPALIRLA